MWAEFDPQTRSSAYAIVTALGELYQAAPVDERKRVTSELGRSAKHIMFQYSKDKAAEAIRNRPSEAIAQGLMAVVVAGGRSDNVTGGSLLSMLLHSSEKSGLDSKEAFAYAAQFAADPVSGTQIREFPLLPAKMRGIDRFGFVERNTRDGVTFEHMVEAMGRPRWWDKLTGRRRYTMEDTLRQLREHERTSESGKK
jgi:hypothetical protein